MLILDADRVEYCQLACKTDSGVEIVPGVSYRQKLYVKGKTFPLSQKQDAIEQSRREFAEKRGLVYILLVIGDDSLTLWYQNDSATLVSPTEDNGS